MKLTGNIKTPVENANSREEAKEIKKIAGTELTDDELEMVSGGNDILDTIKDILEELIDQDDSDEQSLFRNPVK